MQLTTLLVATLLAAVAAAQEARPSGAAAQEARPSGAAAQEARPSGQPTVNAKLLERVSNEYIVKLREGITTASFVSGPQALATQIRHTYDQGSFKGFAGKLTAAQAEQLKQDPRVELVERNQIVRINGQQTNPPSWGLTRVSQRQLALSSPYTYPDSAGAGIEAWIVDTGIYPGHSNFEGRATFAKSFVEGEEATDLNGHGTHVAGTIGSKSYGVAKKVKLYGVKVLDAEGSGTTADVIAGIQYVAQTATKNKSVANMSLGGGKSAALDSAVNAAVDAGVAFIVAAGNEASNACNGSPSGASKAFAVAASNNADRQASFSNYGRCVKLYAPGVDITSTWIGSTSATDTISGTSMASPHVAGVAALYLGEGAASSVSALYKALTDRATPNVIKGASSGTPNKLVYNKPTGA